jgi:hypothetical protein
MSSNLTNAFNHLLGIHSRKVTIERPGIVPAVEIKVTPSNYSRNLAGPEETIIDGREFVITLSALSSVNFPTPRRGDRIKDPDMGTHVISEVRELVGFGGAILGFRVRCS